MSFAPDLTELLARARADLRMGVGVVLTGAGASVLVMAAETLAAARTGAIRPGAWASKAAMISRAANRKMPAFHR